MLIVKDVRNSAPVPQKIRLCSLPRQKLKGLTMLTEVKPSGDKGQILAGQTITVEAVIGVSGCKRKVRNDKFE